MILCRLEDIKGLNVVDREGKSIGIVTDLVADLENSRIRYILVEATASDGVRQILLALPIELSHVTSERVQVDQLRDNLLLSPYYSVDALEDTGSGG